MKYSQKLLEKAAQNAGSWYRLAQALEVQTQNMSAVKNGRRPIPLAWVFDLAVMAGVDPGEALSRVQHDQKLAKATTPKGGRSRGLNLPLWADSEEIRFSL